MEGEDSDGLTARGGVVTSHKFTVFIGGVAAANNYSRTVSDGATGRACEIHLNRSEVNKPPQCELTVSGVSTSDANLVVIKSGVRNSFFIYAGQNGTTSDTLVGKFRVDDVSFKSDGYCKIKGKQWMAGGGGVQLDELTEQAEYKGTLKEILAELLPTAGENSVADSVDVDGLTDTEPITFKVDRNWTRRDAVDKLSNQFGFEYNYKN